MHQVIARYKVKRDRAKENLELVRAVYDELERTKPAGLRYATFLLDDGVSFVHIAQADADPNPLPQIAGVSGVPARDRRPLRGAAAGERGTRGRRLPLPRSGLRPFRPSRYRRSDWRQRPLLGARGGCRASTSVLGQLSRHACSRPVRREGRGRASRAEA
jgi:hypothetical protein